MYELATLPNDIREEPQELSDGEVKKPSDMTRKELEDLKRQLKQRDEQNAQLQSQWNKRNAQKRLRRNN